MESGAARRDHRPLRLDDAAGGGAGGDVRHLAGVVVSRATSRKISAASWFGAWRARPAPRSSSAATRSSALGPDASLDALDNRFYNAAFLVKPDGSTGAVYRKMHLVPFGEYVPLQRLLFFVGPIVEAVSNFTPGDRPRAAAGRRSRCVSTAICYEVIYGSLIRRFVRDGSELLTTITNDAWYGRSSAAYQHWDQAAMRAIENGRYLARAANTGVSGFVDPYGRVLAEVEAVRAGGARAGRPARPNADDLHAHRRPHRLAVAGVHRRRAAGVLAILTLKYNWKFGHGHAVPRCSR